MTLGLRFGERVTGFVTSPGTALVGFVKWIKTGRHTLYHLRTAPTKIYFAWSGVPVHWIFPGSNGALEYNVIPGGF